MEPTQQAPQSGSRFITFVIFGAAILLAGLAMLAFGGSFWSWIAVAAIVMIGGLTLVVHLARRNRRIS